MATSVEPRLKFGASLADAVIIGQGVSHGWSRLLGGLTTASLQRQLADRQHAVSRVGMLLRAPQATALMTGVGACSLIASDDAVMLMLFGRSDAARVRRACEVAGRIADVLPALARALPPTPLERAASALDRVAHARATALNECLPFAISPMPGGIVQVEIETGVSLGGLGAFAPGPGGPLVHWRRGRRAALPAPFDCDAVRTTMATLPAHSTAVFTGSRIQIRIEPRGQGEEMVVNACFDFARTLRDVALGRVTS